MGELRKFVFKLPKTVRHKDARKLINELVRALNEDGELTSFDTALLHRMATAYDAYLSCVEAIAENGMTMKNLKGEVVKRPEANLLRENWAQFLELAKEYGLTTKSRAQIKSRIQDAKGEASPIEEFFADKSPGKGV